jgi:hypothetical protein
MNKPNLILLATLISGAAYSAPLPPAASPAGDSNIVISNKTERYVFDEGSKEHPVIIHQEDKTTYYCSELRTEIRGQNSMMINRV